jgi:spore germination cell wall hydrolase CwlJ-like protein
MITAAQAYEFALLVLCLWREARGESLEGQHAVAWVIKNRVAKGGFFGNGWVGVILKPWQFSSFNGPDKDGKVDANATAFPIPGTASYESCFSAAKHVYEGTAPDPTSGCQYYYAASIAAPKWTEKMTKVVQIGNHIFYRE